MDYIAAKLGSEERARIAVEEVMENTGAPEWAAIEMLVDELEDA